MRDSTRLRPDMIKRCSQKSETDSLDMSPGVCKSASAQNLTIDTNLLYPYHNKLHKTWSLTNTPTHSVENLTKIERSNSLLSKSRVIIPIGEQTRSALQSESFDKAEICPWEVEPEHSADKNQKHVTIANSKEEKEEEKTSPTSQVALVCPWDHLPPPVETKPSEELESPKPQLTVSASAPPTPRPITQDQQVFSFRGTKTRWLSVKSVVNSFDSSKSGNLSREGSQKSNEGAATTSRLGIFNSARRPSDDRRALQIRSMTTADGKPNLVKQSAIRLSSSDSADRSPIRLAVVTSTICPWDVEDVQRERTYENVSLSRQSSKRSSGSSWDAISHSRTPSMHRRGSKRLVPAIPQGGFRQQSFKANVCPWESQEQDTKVSQQAGVRGDVSPWETPATPAAHRDLQAQQSLKRSTDVCPWEPQVPVIRQGSDYTNVCPWESQEVVYENLNPKESIGSLKVPQKQPEAVKAARFSGSQKESHPKSPVHLGVPMSKMPESCPWDFPDPPPLSETICPWEEGSMETSLTVTRKDSTTQMTIKVDVCPWQSEQQASLEDDRQCSKDRGSVCPWKEEQPQPVAHTKMVAQSQENIANVCPWESQDKLQPSQEATYANICPWETEGGTGIKEKESQQSSGESLVKMQESGGSKVDVCPWESEDSKTVKSQESGRASVCPKDGQNVVQKQDSSGSTTGNVCPWETQDIKDKIKEDSPKHANVCPWESEEPDLVKKQDSGGTKDTKIIKKQESSCSSRAEVCPWEEGGPAGVSKQDSGSRTSVCPWESEQPNLVKKQDSSSGSRVDVCPWESEESVMVKKQDSGGVKETKVMKKQDSTGSKVSVCPWELQETEVVKKQESRANVCPWETEEPKVLKKQESITSSKADVCPWEVQEPKIVKKQDSKTSSTGSRGEVCPWEVEEPKVSKQDSKADVCPWESEVTTVAKKQDSGGTMERKVFKKQDSKTSSSSRPEVCPWESEQPKVLKNQESRVDVCPLEVGGSEVVKKQDSESRVDVCPWESGEPKAKMLKTQESISSNKADVCPWEVPEPQEVKRQDSRVDVCAWETEEQIAPRSRQDSTEAEVRSRTHSVASRTLSVSESPKIHVRSSIGEASVGHSPEHRGGDGDEGKASLALGRRDALCPWEMGQSGSFTDNTSDVFTWEPENIPEEEEDEDGDAESAAEALVFPPDL